MMRCHFECFEKDNFCDICPFCHANIKNMEESELSEHMTIHKQLGHKRLPKQKHLSTLF